MILPNVCVQDDLGVQCHDCTCRYRTVAVIPCFGRFRLLEKTVERLYKVNRITKVVLMGHEPGVKNIADKTNSVFVHHKNNPLGRKWNAGFEAARKLRPDAVLFVGSSDWISANWMPEALKHIKDYDLIGRLDCYLYDINTIGKNRLVHWPGYGHGVRAEEPIGIGRVISARVLDKINWKPFDDSRDNSMDWFMYDAVLKHSGKIKLMDNDTFSMAISTNHWPNKHSFEAHWRNKLPSRKIESSKMNEFIENNFPEALRIFTK